MLNKVIMMIATLAICASSITLTGCEDPEAKAKAELKAKIEKQAHDFGQATNEDIMNIMSNLAKKKDNAEEK